MGDATADRDLRLDARLNRQKILEAAARVLGADSGASMQAIADAAGVTRLTVYRRFQTREELIDELRTTALQAIAIEMKQASEAAATGLDALRATGTALAGVYRVYPAPGVIFPGAYGPDNLPPLSEEIDRTFEQIVARGERDGTLRTGLSPVLVRLILLGGLDPAMRFALAEGRDPGAEVDAIIDVVLEGVRAKD